MLVKLSPYLIALLVGLLVGIERERREIKSTKTMGLRSFLLLSLAGALAGGINQPLIALGLMLFSASAVIASYILSAQFRNTQEKSAGITTEIAAVVTFSLSYYAHHEPILSLVIGIGMALILHNKTLLHNFVQQYLTQEEIQAALVLLLLAIGVIPLIPNQAIDHFHIFNPFRLAIIIALIGGIQFTGYAVSRILGEKIGLPLAGFLAGSISSTAAFASYPRLAKVTPENSITIASAAVFAVVAMLMEVFFLIAPISLPLVYALVIPLGILVMIAAVLGVILAREEKSDSARIVHSNPLNLPSAIKLGALLTALMFLVDLSARFLGDTFTKMVSFIAALFELHGVVIGNANMLANKTVDLPTAASTILLAIIATMVSKIALTAFLATGFYRKLMMGILGGFFLASIAVWTLIKIFPVLLLGSSA